MSTPALSLQLYTLRVELKEDFEGTLRRVAEIGYENVEPFNLPGMADDLAGALADNDLAAPSAHCGLLGTDLGPILDAASRLGVGTVIEPHAVPDRWQSVDGIARIADELNRAAIEAARHGLRVGYHNHAHELQSVIDGRTGLELLADRLDPAVVLELDTYWAAVGGQDVVALLGRLGDRVRFLHVKDGPVEADSSSQVPVGKGAMPVPAILDAATACEYAVVELDDFAGDMLEAVEDSFAYLSEQV